MFHFRGFAVATVIVVLSAVAGCHGRSHASPPSDAARDDFGTTIGSAAPAHRIASLNPTTTEILFAIGAGPRLVGRSQYDLFPDSATRVASLGPALRPSVEAIAAVHPDLVLLYASDDNRPAADRLRQLGIRVLAFKIDSIAQFARDTRALGRLTGDSATAATLVDTVMATLDSVRRATAPLTHPTVFMPTWEKPVIAIGGGSFMSELVAIAGARNIYADIDKPSVTVTLEDVVQRNPDCVLSGLASADQMRASPVWRAIPAVRAGHVLAMNLDIVTRPSVQLGTAAVLLARLLHPNAAR